jgi:hypothetical protein
MSSERKVGWSEQEQGLLSQLEYLIVFMLFYTVCSFAPRRVSNKTFSNNNVIFVFLRNESGTRLLGEENVGILLSS